MALPRPPGDKDMHKDRVILRALEMSDLDRVLKWHNDAGLYETLGGTYRPVSRATEQAWLRRKCVFSTSEANLAICVARTEAHIGNCTCATWIPRHATLRCICSWVIGETGPRVMAVQPCGNCCRWPSRRWACSAFTFMCSRITRRQSGRTKSVGSWSKDACDVQAFKQGRFKDMLVMGLCEADTEVRRQGKGRTQA